MTFALLLLFAGATNDLEDALKKITEVYALVEQQAAEAVDPDVALFQGAIPSMMRGLDPHSVFFTSDQFEQLQEMEHSTSKGFGTIVSVLPGRVIVLQTFPGSPAAKIGIQPGDEIIAVNNIRLEWLEMEQLIQLLGETRRSEALLSVRRQGSSALLEFKMSPQELASPSVDRSFLLQPGIGYVRATSFEGDTGKLIKAAIDDLGGNALHGLVLDLRENPGGIVDAAIETAELFLGPGEKVVTTRGRAHPSEDTVTPDSAKPYTFPLAILIDGKTASASEIVTGAMQDHKRAVVLGSQSYGKALVQTVFPLEEGTGLALTTAYYYTPNGRSIQRPLSEGLLNKVTQRTDAGGLTPDIQVAPEPVTRLRAYLDASGYLTNFATQKLHSEPGFDPGPALSDKLLDELRVYLSEHNVVPSVPEWSADREWIRSRLQQELLNQTAGVAKGDEVQMQRDPIVQRAVQALTAPGR